MRKPGEALYDVVLDPYCVWVSGLRSATSHISEYVAKCSEPCVDFSGEPKDSKDPYIIDS